jgi:uncharacterized protein YjiS (DUF1127 family)
MRAIDQNSMLWPAFMLVTAALQQPVVPADARPRQTPARAPRWLRRARDTIALWQERTHGRQQLLRLDGHVLRDIGITRLQAEAEADKPFWRA